MKAEVLHTIQLTTTPQDLKALAEEWEKEFDPSNPKTFYKTIDTLRIALKMDDTMYFHQSGKLINRLKG